MKESTPNCKINNIATTWRMLVGRPANVTVGTCQEVVGWGGRGREGTPFNSLFYGLFVYFPLQLANPTNCNMWILTHGGFFFFFFQKMFQKSSSTSSRFSTFLKSFFFRCSSKILKYSLDVLKESRNYIFKCIRFYDSMKLCYIDMHCLYTTLLRETWVSIAN